MTLAHQSLKDAVSKAGSNSALASAIGCSATAVWQMVNKAQRLSVDYVLTVEKLYGSSRHNLRPDIYPREPLFPVGHPRAAASGSLGHGDTGGSASVKDARLLSPGTGIARAIEAPFCNPEKPPDD
ncbi:YdaS family helix-turn-helix protein [Novosphingopyxis sp. YJ-S2-01]|uniref:transcriptional regulator n=1 Tax=Novosphingopyxis sp. YJ-S2-01 TaxID=2794021 RepID=UPI0018DC4833|nr:helix-turn-helix domain-containing protein [Novosphingopyxis sp. YJ-S2-01]